MKQLVSVSLLVFFLSGCGFGNSSLEEDPNELPDQQYLFYGRYTNMAWVPTDRGFTIDREGRILAFDLEGDSDLWQAAQEGLYSLSAFENNIHQNSWKIEAEALNYLQHFKLAVDEVPLKKLSPVETVGADFGTISFYLLVKEPETEAYREYLLSTDGDWQIARQGVKSKAVSEWLASIYEEVKKQF